MTLPADHQYVTASNAGPGAPFAQIECPSDDAEATAQDIRRVAAVSLANDADLRGKVSGIGNDYIVGNGVPLPGGYNPGTYPIWIRGTGLKLDTLLGTIESLANITQKGPIVLSGGGAVLSVRTGSLPPLTSIITTGADEYEQGGSLSASIHHTVRSTNPVPPNGARIRVVAVNPAHDVVLLREDSSELATLPAGVHSSVDLTYRASAGKWRVTMSMDADRSNATP